MFRNVSGKIKMMAVVLLVVGLFASLVGGIAVIDNGNEFSVPAGLGVMIGGAAVSFAISFLVYGFGQIVENTDKMAENATPPMPAVRSNAYGNKNGERRAEQPNTTGMNAPYARNLAFIDAPKGKCELCGKEDIQILKCVINDNYGKRYHHICEDCMRKTKGTPV